MKRILIVACATSALCAGVITSSAGASAGVTGLDACEKLEPRPNVIGIWCDGQNVFVNSLHWNKWTTNKGVGEGFLHVNDCNPNCASGDVETYPVEVKLYDRGKSKCNGQDQGDVPQDQAERPGPAPGLSLALQRRRPLLRQVARCR